VEEYVLAGVKRILLTTVDAEVVSPVEALLCSVQAPAQVPPWVCSPTGSPRLGPLRCLLSDARCMSNALSEFLIANCFGPRPRQLGPGQTVQALSDVKIAHYRNVNC
jgi:hypothetical protein